MSNRKIRQQTPGYDIVLTFCAYALAVLGTVAIPVAFTEVIDRYPVIERELRVLSLLVALAAVILSWTTSALLFLLRDVGRTIRARHHDTFRSTHHDHDSTSP